MADRPMRDQLLDALRDLIADRGYSPSYRELADAVGLGGPSAVLYHLEQLRAAGLVTYVPGEARTVRPVPDPWVGSGPASRHDIRPWEGCGVVGMPEPPEHAPVAPTRTEVAS